MKRANIFINISFLFIYASIVVSGQYNSTTYYMQNLPQSTLLNPAIQPGCGFFLSLGGLTMDINNSALSFYDVISYNEDYDLYYSPFDSLATQADKNEFIGKFKDLSTISSAFNATIFGMGFKVDNNYITFHVAERVNTNLDYPADFIRLLINGNGEPGEYNWSGLGGRISAYQEMALSFSKNIDDRLTFGVRGKLLFGQMDFGVSKQNIILDVDTFSIDITSSFEMNGSSSLVNIAESVEGGIDSVSLSSLDASEITSILLGKKNIGFGADLGINFNINDKLSLSGGIIDLGMIRWKNDVFNLISDGEFSFQGAELDLLGGNEDEDDTTNFFTDFIDSLKNTFAITPSYSAYSTFLTAKLIFGLNYKLHEKVDIGLLSYTEIYRKKFFPRVTISANFRPFRFFNTSFSYSVLNKEYYNLGFGLSFKPGPFNWYVIGDTFPMVMTKGTPIPVHSKGFRIQAGFNLAFGFEKKAKGQNDMPLISF